MAARTRASTSALVGAERLMTRLTVAMEQPARSATVLMVTMRGTSDPGGLQWSVKPFSDQ